ncbi:hypothetical protein CRENBAI_010569 [Crenichthys baileyi]|uniref:Uncharacterized protein n=1 Tax=Crenichthys baileyi TaxID=28760 RepID=A0AAV9SC40_9TELE
MPVQRHRVVPDTKPGEAEHGDQRKPYPIDTVRSHELNTIDLTGKLVQEHSLSRLKVTSPRESELVVDDELRPRLGTGLPSLKSQISESPPRTSRVPEMLCQARPPCNPPALFRTTRCRIGYQI